MTSVEVDSATFRDLTLIASAAGITRGEAVALLVERFHEASAAPEQLPPARPTIPVHAIYHGRRVEGEFDSATAGLTVTSDPLAGKWFQTPSGAAKAVVAAIKPGVTPNRSGYDFWFVTSTGKTLASVRRPT